MQGLTGARRHTGREFSAPGSAKVPPVAGLPGFAFSFSRPFSSWRLKEKSPPALRVGRSAWQPARQLRWRGGCARRPGIPGATCRGRNSWKGAPQAHTLHVSRDVPPSSAGFIIGEGGRGNAGMDARAVGIPPPESDRDGFPRRPVVVAARIPQGPDARIRRGMPARSACPDTRVPRRQGKVVVLTGAVIRQVHGKSFGKVHGGAGGVFDGLIIGACRVGKRVRKPPGPRSGPARRTRGVVRYSEPPRGWCAAAARPGTSPGAFFAPADTCIQAAARNESGRRTPPLRAGSRAASPFPPTGFKFGGVARKGGSGGKGRRGGAGFCRSGKESPRGRSGLAAAGGVACGCRHADHGRWFVIVVM